MQYLIIAVVLMALCVFGFSCRKSTLAPPPGGQSPQPVTVTSGNFLSQQDIQEQLARIAKKPPPKNLAMGAMCYDIAGPPLRIDYVCPSCGEKTLYAVDTDADEKVRQQHWKTAWVIQELESLRRLTQQIDTLDVALDESQFCCHCNSAIKDPKVGLVITYPDRLEPHRVWDVHWTDLTMLKAAAEGKLKYKGKQGNEVAMKDHLPRLEELLGVDIENAD